MDTNEIVTKYIDAWNHKNVAGLIDLMHPGAAYHDAFWAETCVGPDLVQYFQDAMAEEPFWYEQVGETISKGNSVVFRYSAPRSRRLASRYTTAPKFSACGTEKS